MCDKVATCKSQCCLPLYQMEKEALWLWEDFNTEFSEIELLKIKFYPEDITQSFQISLYCYFLCDLIEVVKDANCKVSSLSNH